MTQTTGSQVFCGPFSQNDLVSFQAAVSFANTHWRKALSDTAHQIMWFILESTVRFGKFERRITKRRFYKGFDPNPSTNFSGIAPIEYVSDPAFYRGLKELINLGVVQDKGNQRYALNFSITLLDLIGHESVVKRILNAHKRGGLLSTYDGLKAWAKSLTERLLITSKGKSKPLPASKPKPTQRGGFQKAANTLITATADYFLRRRHISYDGSGLRYTLTNRNSTIPSDKSSVMEAGIMGKTAQEILAAVTADTDAKRDKLRSKKRKRMNLSDRMQLFEQAWMRGQRTRDTSLPPTRLVARHRASVKNILLKPAEGTDLDTEAFAAWCAEHWDAIGAQYFKKSKRYPNNPAIAWLVACSDVYLLAWQQRDFLETGLDRKTLMQQAKRGVKAEEHINAVNSAALERVKLLEAKLADAEKRLDAASKTGKLEPDEFDSEIQDYLMDQGFDFDAKPVTYDEDDWVDPPAKSKKRKIRRKRK